MKKIMIIAAVAMAAIASQAATFKWSTTATGKVYEAGTTTVLASGMAYLFDSATMTQAALVESLAAGALDLSKAVDSTAVSAGVVAAKVASYGEIGTTYTFYLAVVDADNNLFVGPTKNAMGVEGKDSAVSFSAAAASKLAFNDASAGYSAAGWYQSVPEPTSGLLMLLGMAGLALRRRRA